MNDKSLQDMIKFKFLHPVEVKYADRGKLYLREGYKKALAESIATEIEKDYIRRDSIKIDEKKVDKVLLGLGICNLMTRQPITVALTRGDIIKDK